jgi:hypothetical protein
MLLTLNSLDDSLLCKSGTFQPRCEITAKKPNYTTSQRIVYICEFRMRFHFKLARFKKYIFLK